MGKKTYIISTGSRDTCTNESSNYPFGKNVFISLKNTHQVQLCALLNFHKWKIMQRDFIIKFCSSKLGQKTPQNIIIKDLSESCCSPEGNNEHDRNCAIESQHCESEMPSVVSELAEINNTIPTSIKNIDTINTQHILTKSLVFENGSEILNLNSGVIRLPKKSTKLTRKLVPRLLVSSDNTNGANNVARIKSLSIKTPSKIDLSNNKCLIIKSNSTKEKIPLTRAVFESNGKAPVQLRLPKDVNNCSGWDSLPLKSNRNSCHKKINVNLEKSRKATSTVVNKQDFTSESEPFCVISEVIGNADAAFSGKVGSRKHVTDILKPRIIISKKPTHSTEANGYPGLCGDALEETLAIIDGQSILSVSDIKAREGNAVEFLETEEVASCNFEENQDLNDTEFWETLSLSLNESSFENSNPSFSNPNDTQGMTAEISRTETETSKNTQPERTFSGVNGSPKWTKQSAIQLITPKKTNDITKIKGWRRKQFLVEKPTTIEFYRLEEGTEEQRIRVQNDSEFLSSEIEEPGNLENAFVCDSLDEFLDREVELNVGYEIPHLYAEVGIKLTSDDIASKPNLSDRDFKEVENRYCVPVHSEKNNIFNLDEIEKERFKSGKRRIEDNPKPCKFLKFQENRRQSICQKPTEKLNSGKKYNLTFEAVKERLKEKGTILKVVGRNTKSADNVKLETKLLGLVVYPGPFRPLHPMVRHHIQKLRSYSTTIDKNWATFAASAVYDKDKCYKRRILPVQCCVKVKNHAKKFIGGDLLVGNCPVTVNTKEFHGSLVVEKQCPSEVNAIELNGDNLFIEEQCSASSTTPNSTNCGKETIKLKKCHVVIDKIDLVESLPPWCMVHHTYNCEPCGLSNRKLPISDEMFTKRILEHKKEPVMPPQVSFDRKIANLLAKKLSILKFRGNTLTSIDCLKKLVPDNVEFIKLNFVKESFLNSYISIWFLKQEGPWTKSRAFLTFSNTPPMPNAVNLKSNALSVKNLPKVITEIVSSEKIFSPNEYAILHCNGEIWEIHGSLNIAFGRASKNVEQIFASLHLPELKELQKVAQKILSVTAVKWWIVDLSQKFKLVEIKFGNVISVLSRSKFLESVRCETHGFVPIKKNSAGRILGAYIIKPLLPFILMGPYYLLETHNMILKGERSTLPFMYFGKEHVSKESPLKYFINSVIKDVEDNFKVLDGLWLYDKMCLDNTSYIEVLTRNVGTSLTNKFASIDIDHGYSLSSLTKGLPSEGMARVLNSKDVEEEVKRVPVYLYFDFIDLGYLEGDLQRDKSVIICHPLDRQTQVKSHKVGDWFIRTIKRRIEFIPKYLKVKWFITKHKEDLRERRPFSRFFLDGAHILTKGGLLHLLEMSESTVRNLRLQGKEIARAIRESQFIKVMVETKKLASLLSKFQTKSLTVADIITMAVIEIRRLKSCEMCFLKKKIKLEKKKVHLLSRFIKALNSWQRRDHVKLKKIESIQHFFIKKDGALCKKFVRKLKKSKIGRKYFRWNQNLYSVRKDPDSDDGDEARPKKGRRTRR